MPSSAALQPLNTEPLLFHLPCAIAPSLYLMHLAHAPCLSSCSACLYAAFESYMCPLAKMVEAGGERSRVQSLASSLKFLESRPLSRRSSKLPVVERYLPRITEERITTIDNDLETSRSSHDLPQLVAAGLEVPPESICPLCLNLGNEVWNADYRKKYGLGSYLRRYNSAKDVVRNAMQGCSGCKVVAWALKPYFRWMKEQYGDIVLRIGKGFFNYTGEWASRDMGYHWRPKTTESVCGVIVLRITPPESGEVTSDAPEGSSRS